MEIVGKEWGRGGYIVAKAKVKKQDNTHGRV